MIIFFEAAPVNVDAAGFEAVGLDIVANAEVFEAGTTTELTALDVVTEVVDVERSGKVLVPPRMTLAEMTGLVAKTMVTLLLVMVHCVVTTGLLWKVIVDVPEGTSHSVLLLVAFNTTGEVMVVVNDDFDILDKPGSLLVKVDE